MSKARMEAIIRKPLGNPAPDDGGVHKLLEKLGGSKRHHEGPPSRTSR